MLRLLGSAAVGVLAAAVGTGAHRFNPPVGLLLALLIVASAGVLVRAWAGPWGVVMLGAVLLVVIIVLARPGPGGDALVVAQPVGYGWFGSVLVVAAVALLPRPPARSRTSRIRRAAPRPARPGPGGDARAR